MNAPCDNYFEDTGGTGGKILMGDAALSAMIVNRIWFELNNNQLYDRKRPYCVKLNEWTGNYDIAKSKYVRGQMR